MYIPENYEAIEKYQNALAQTTATQVAYGPSLKPSGFSQSSAILEDPCEGGCGQHHYKDGPGTEF